MPSFASWLFCFIYIMDDLVLESQNGLPIKFISHCTDVLCTSKTLAKYSE